MAEGQELPRRRPPTLLHRPGKRRRRTAASRGLRSEFLAGIKTKPAVAAKFLQGDEFVKAVERFCESSHVLVVQEKQNGDLRRPTLMWL